jgi:hypothetical protein
MKPFPFPRSMAVLLAAGALALGAMLLGTGCDRKDHSDSHAAHGHEGKSHAQGHKHGRAEAAEKSPAPGSGHGHEHDESPSGASFKAGKGVMLTEETRRSLGVEITDLAERVLPNQIRLTLQVFDEKHHHAVNDDDHAGCDVSGSGFLATNRAAMVKAGQPVQVFARTNQALDGVVLAVQKALALGETEVVIGVSNATTALKPGAFVPARITVPRAESVPAIPHAALLRTSEGTFVYAVNGDAYYRTAVRTGAEADGWVEVTEGLLPGDQVVTKAVQTLWLIELRATKGGGHSH